MKIDCPGLLFDEEKHQYQMEGKVLNSISKIIQLGGVSSFEGGGSSEAMLRGTLMHLLAEGLSTEDGVKVNRALALMDPEDVTTVVDSLDVLFNRHGFTTLQCEARMGYAPELLAGTVDLLAQKGDDIYIIDYKSGGSYPQYKVQLGGYARLAGILTKRPPTVFKVGAMYFKSKSLVIYDTEKCVDIFDAVYKVAMFKIGHGLA